MEDGGKLRVSPMKRASIFNCGDIRFRKCVLDRRPERLTVTVIVKSMHFPPKKLLAEGSPKLTGMPRWLDEAIGDASDVLGG